MDGIHDLGGKAGYGMVDKTSSVSGEHGPFHGRWEARVFACLGAAWRCKALRNVDQFRHAIERIAPDAYLTDGYYGRWLGGLETLFVEANVVTTEAIDDKVRELTGRAGPVHAAARPSPTPDVVSYASSARTARRNLESAPRFSEGDWIRTARHPVPGHTRLPAYIRGARGYVHSRHGGWVYPDSNAHGKGERPSHLYTVRFEGAELWGAESEPGTSVYIDLFEPYLQPV